MNKTKTKMGRPTDYQPDYDRQVFLLCKLGATDKECAEFFEVCEATLNNWKIKFPKFLESLREGKEISDAKVVRKLFERATGYSHPDTKIVSHGGKITEIREFIRHYPPDTTACIFWLKNRRPEDWRDTRHLEHKGDLNIAALEAGRKRLQNLEKPND